MVAIRIFTLGREQGELTILKRAGRVDYTLEIGLSMPKYKRWSKLSTVIDNYLLKPQYVIIYRWVIKMTYLEYFCWMYYYEFIYIIKIIFLANFSKRSTYESGRILIILVLNYFLWLYDKLIRKCERMVNVLCEMTFTCT